MKNKDGLQTPRTVFQKMIDDRILAREDYLAKCRIEALESDRCNLRNFQDGFWIGVLLVLTVGVVVWFFVVWLG